LHQKSLNDIKNENTVFYTDSKSLIKELTNFKSKNAEDELDNELENIEIKR